MARAVIEAVVKARPASAKGASVETSHSGATMLPGMRVDVAHSLSR